MKKILNVLLLTLNLAQAIPWPFAPQDSPQGVDNDFGEYQDKGGKQYFHPGIDIEKNEGEPVYSVSHGWVQLIWTGGSDPNRYWSIRITQNQNGSGDRWEYGHLEKESIIEAGIGTWTGAGPATMTVVNSNVSQGTLLGKVVDWFDWEPDFDHLHFNVYQNGHLINPLLVLSPNTDVIYPTIIEDDIDFCKNKTHDFIFDTKDGKKVLWGNVDIVANIWDVICPYVPSLNRKVGVKKASYQITYMLDNDTSLVT